MSNLNTIYIQHAEYLMGNDEETIKVLVDYHNNKFELVTVDKQPSAELAAEINEQVTEMLARKSQKNVFKN